MLLQQLRKKPFCNDVHYFLIALVLLLVSFIYPYLIIGLIIYLIFVGIKTKYLKPIFLLIFVVLIISGIINVLKQNNKKNSYYGVVESISSDYYIISDGLIRIKAYDKKHTYIPSDYVYIEIDIYDDNKSYDSDMDSSLYLLSNNIYYQGRVKNSKYIKKSFSIGYIRYCILDYLEAKLSTESFKYVSSLIFNNNLLDDNIKDSYSVLGISHILAISGLHILILFKLLSYILLKLFKYYKSLIPITIISLYVIIIGCPLSALRALLFLILSSLNNYGNIKYTKLDILSITFIIMILLNPFSAYSYGFILSFLVSFILIVNKELFNDKGLKKAIKDYIIIFLGILPIIVNISNKISVLSIIFSPILSSIVSFILIPLSYLLCIAPQLDIIFKCIFIFINFLVEEMSLVSIIIHSQSFNIFMIIIYYFLFGYLIIGLLKKSYIRPIGYLSLFLFLFLNLKYLNPLTRVVFIDVGQGDSALICDKHNNANILIDAYSSYNYLKSEGIDRLDYLILTHSDNDHLGDYEKIINDFNVKVVLYPMFDDGFKDISFKARSIGIKNGYSFKIGNINGLCIGPIEKYDDSNSNSLVFKINIYNTSFLFTGDMTKKEEQDLIGLYSNVLDSDILKVGHHGSNTSTSEDFLYLVSPIYSVISVGKYNYYGLPHDEIVNRLKGVGNVYQTKDCGNISFYVLENKVMVSTYR